MYDSLVFARFWYGEPDSQVKCGSYGSMNLTMHGLWPQYGKKVNGHGWPQFCDAKDKIIPSVTKAMTPLWKKYAPSYPPNNGDGRHYSGLAAHEWQRHGVCYSPSVTTATSEVMQVAVQTAYFKEQIMLMQKYPTPALLRNAQLAGTKTLGLAALQAAFGGKGMASLSCKGNRLTMVSLCFSRVDPTTSDPTGGALKRVACDPMVLTSSYDNGCVVNKIDPVTIHHSCGGGGGSSPPPPSGGGAASCGGSTCSFTPGKKCQCNSKCAKYKNCCKDYKTSKCGGGAGVPPAPAGGKGSCKGSTCHFKKGGSCQCNPGCVSFGDCCGDYKTTCGAAKPPPSPRRASHPSFDSQTVPYTMKWLPATTNAAANGPLSVTPFFSPDTSVSTIIAFIDAVPAGGALDIGTPGFLSWSKLTPFSGCTGGTAAACSAEKFPVFQAVLNAVHQRQVQVRILTNDFRNKVCAGKIDPLTFLKLNGVSITYYASTTFLHEKYLASYKKKADKYPSRASLSSINFSHNSFTNDREAGVILDGSGAAPLLKLTTDVFNADVAQGKPFAKVHAYTNGDMVIIKSAAKRVPIIPTPPTKNRYTSPTPVAIQTTGSVTVFASPDFSLATLLAHVNSARKTFELYIYQVTDDRLCNALQALHVKGVKVTIMVSRDIYGKSDEKRAQSCYAQLNAAGVQVHMAKCVSFAYYSHNKFWIVDGVSTGMSSGNWSPTDFPGEAKVFPPWHGSANAAPKWRDANRDYTLKMQSADIAAVFRKVLSGDMTRATLWTKTGRYSGRRPRLPMDVHADDGGGCDAACRAAAGKKIIGGITNALKKGKPSSARDRLTAGFCAVAVVALIGGFAFFGKKRAKVGTSFVDLDAQFQPSGFTPGSVPGVVAGTPPMV